jgi:hypothetical protein
MGLGPIGAAGTSICRGGRPRPAPARGGRARAPGLLPRVPRVHAAGGGGAGGRRRGGRVRVRVRVREARRVEAGGGGAV